MVPFVSVECEIEGVDKEEIGGNVRDEVAIVVCENEGVCEVTFQFVDVGVVPGNPVFPPLIKHDVGCAVVARKEVREPGGCNVEGSGKTVELDFPRCVNDVIPVGYSGGHIVVNAQCVNALPVAENVGERETEDEK